MGGAVVLLLVSFGLYTDSFAGLLLGCSLDSVEI